MKQEKVQDAIWRLSLAKTAIDKNLAKANYEETGKELVAKAAARIKQRINVELKALYKQLEKEPVKHKTQKGEIYCCPDCGKRIYHSSNAQYCGRCGQRLKSRKIKNEFKRKE